MRQRHWSQGLFLIGLALLTAAMIPACSGGGSGSATANPPGPGPGPATAGHVIHVSSASGPHAIAANSSTIVRTVTFTPTNPNDFVVFAQVEGTYTASSLNNDELEVLILGPSGTTAFSEKSLRVSAPGTRAFRVTAYGGIREPVYRVHFLVHTGASWVGQIDTLKITFTTAEGVTVVEPSASISG